LSHDANQPTLSARRDDPFTARLGRLGFIEAIALDAFERAKDDPAPIGPTLRLTFDLGRRLELGGLLRILPHLPRHPDWLHARAVYDPIAWEYLVEPPEPGVLRALIAQQLVTVGAQTNNPDKVALWQMLVDAEFESYLAHLLRRHQLEASWARELVERLTPELPALCLARRRALAWSGVREGAAAFLRSRGDGRQSFEAMACELRRQARWMLRNAPEANRWLPRGGWRQPLLLTVFLSLVPLGPSYWTEVPSLEALP
jgi:hypothetical protein